MHRTEKNVQLIFCSLTEQLISKGYMTETLKDVGTENIRYLMFYQKNDSCIYGIESSETFSLEDVAANLPDLYFHIGCIVKKENIYKLMYYDFFAYTKNLCTEILESLETVSNSSITNAANHYEEWKKRNRLIVCI